VKVAHIATSDLSLVYLLLNQLSHFRDAGYDVTGIAARGPSAEILAGASVPFIAIPVSRRFGPLSDLRAVIELYRILKREQFDIVHTHTPKGGLLGQYAALAAGIPLRVHTIHGLYFPGTMLPKHRWRYVWLERITMAFSHHNFSQNPEDVTVAVDERIVRRDRIELLGNGIDLTRFDPGSHLEGARQALRAELGFDDRTVVVGMVARLVAEKGYLEVFEAVKTVKARVPEARFILIGGFEDKPDALTPDALVRHGIDDVTTFLGHRDHIERFYAAMDVFMLPSHREGFPRSVMEASAMGLPCIVTDIRGCRQTVDHEVTGVIVPPRDSGALARALERLLISPDLRARMGTAARAKATREFDETKIISTILNAYRRLAPVRRPLGARLREAFRTLVREPRPPQGARVEERPKRSFFG